jgi:hypothetical protein
MSSLKAWISVYAFILCFCCTCDGPITRPRSLTVCVKKAYKTEEEARTQQRAVDSLMNEWMNVQCQKTNFMRNWFLNMNKYKAKGRLFCFWMCIWKLEKSLFIWFFFLICRNRNSIGASQKPWSYFYQ